MKRFVLLIFALMAPVMVWAVPHYNTVSGRTMGLTGHLTSIFNGVCYVIGIGLLGAAINMYREHRKNPVQYPISRPIVILILSVLLILLPLLGSLTIGGAIANAA